jgi:hypothetical protein
MPAPSRAVAYLAIDSERDYQDSRWGHSASSGAPGNGDRTIDEFALYISEYADQLRHVCGTSDDPIKKLDAVRKVAALGVACMEQHGAPYRE